MSIEVIIPRVGESISEVHIGQILVADGATVKEGDELLEIETEKVNQLLYAPKSGVIHWSVATGDTVSVGKVIAMIDPSSAASSSPPPSQEPSAPLPEVPPIIQPNEERPTPSQEARKDASDFMEELIEEPKESIKPAPKPQVGGEERQKMSPIRMAIADRLVKAKAETASLTTFNEIDMTKVMEIREKYQENFKKRHGVKIGFLSFFVKATLNALREFPIVGSTIEGKEIVRKLPLNLGVAVSTDRGLIVPVLKNGDSLSFAEIEKEIELLAKKARTGGLLVDEIRGASFTITNGGIFGSLLSTPILNFPQSAILGLHKIEKRPKVIGDQIVIRSMMYVALTYDHRLIDGREAVLFLVRIKECIEDPERMLIDI